MPVAPLFKSGTPTIAKKLMPVCHRHRHFLPVSAMTKLRHLDYGSPNPNRPRKLMPVCTMIQARYPAYVLVTPTGMAISCRSAP